MSVICLYVRLYNCFRQTERLDTEDAEIKEPSAKNPELSKLFSIKNGAGKGGRGIIVINLLQK